MYDSVNTALPIEYLRCLYLLLRIAVFFFFVFFGGKVSVSF